jgi:four helix bundle protein
MGYQEIEDLDVFQDIETMSDEIWDMVSKWGYFAKDTVGKQLVKAVDSVGANLVESNGRYHYRDSLNFLYFARGSLKETRYWLKRANKRKLMTDEQGDNYLKRFEICLKQLNSLITKRRGKQSPNHLVTQ